jgi:hypothetical protein
VAFITAISAPPEGREIHQWPVEGRRLVLVSLRRPTVFLNTEVLREVIEAKVKGKEIVTPETPKRPRVANLMEALQKSLSERPLSKAEGRRAVTRKRPRPGRRKAA